MLTSDQQKHRFLKNNTFLLSGPGSLVALSVTGILAAGCTPQADLLPERTPPAVSGKAPGDGSEEAAGQRSAAQSQGKEQRYLRTPATYTVQKGDSLTGIAERFKIGHHEIAAANNIRYDQQRNWYVLYPGQTLILPGKYADLQKSPAEYPGDAVTLKNDGRQRDFFYHLVRKGESLWNISRRYGVQIHRIAQDNRIADPGNILYGTLLRIPAAEHSSWNDKPFGEMDRQDKIRFLQQRTIQDGHPYLHLIVDIAEEYGIDARLYASLIWEESWFQADARSQDNCLKLAQLDPRFHRVTENIRENFKKSLRYLRHEFVFYRNKGFDMRSATICALAAYNGGNTRIRRYIRHGRWDGIHIETLPLKETRDHLRKVLKRCRDNYHAVL